MMMAIGECDLPKEVFPSQTSMHHCLLFGADVTCMAAVALVSRRRRAATLSTAQRLTLRNPLLWNTSEWRDATITQGEKLVFFFRHGESVANVAKREALREDRARRDGKFSAEEAYRNWELLADAVLTPEGEAQARAAAAAATSSGVRPQLIVCSPMTRAIQTAALMFEADIAAGVPLCVRPELREYFPRLMEDRGRPLAQLRQCPVLRALPNPELIAGALSKAATADWQGAWDSSWACGDGWKAHCGAPADIAIESSLRPIMASIRTRRAFEGSRPLSADDGERSEAFTRWLAAQPAERIATVSHWGTMNNLLNRHPCIEASGLERRPTKASWGAAWPPLMARLEVANCEGIATVAQLEALRS